MAVQKRSEKYTCTLSSGVRGLRLHMHGDCSRLEMHTNLLKISFLNRRTDLLISPLEIFSVKREMIQSQSTGQ